MNVHPYASHDAGQCRRYEDGRDGALPQPLTWRPGWRESDRPIRVSRKMSRADAIQWTILAICALYFMGQIVRAAIVDHAY